MNTSGSVYRQLKKALFTGKQKTWIYITGILWIAVIVQIGVNRLLIPKVSLLEAFVGTNTNVSSYELEMYASCGKGILSEEEKNAYIYYIAENIGLKIEQTPSVTINGEESEVVVEKTGKNADTSVKIVTLKQQDTEGAGNYHNYILIRLKLYDNTESLLSYRKILEKTLKDLGAENIQTTMQLSSKYKGQLGMDSRNQITDDMIRSLGGKEAYAYREESLYTVYAYSGLLKEYVTSMGTKINIHIAIQYDEDTDSTIVYLGTPVINGGY
ncbi:YwmB family TATA-box binding protein [Clostridium sp. KNHs205]|jgi:hypothetical protein|uniref:YwmB family TATA-box binding protein n=1 Tax=Clostridium sp. KNHs205 TaxID=1449050 RepID=UPI00051AD67D|nr:YwmB family TATA-box binding protein [Clostridium sp. KNHs205]